MVEITHNPIDTDAVLSSVRSPLAGANLLFTGTTRQFTGDFETTSLNYQGYREMAEVQLAALRDEAMQRWPIERCSIVHRLGEVKLEEISVAVAVSTPHRNDCFAACAWIMDELKQRVPIWKQEHGPDGSTEWIHPNQPPGISHRGSE